MPEAQSKGDPFGEPVVLGSEEELALLMPLKSHIIQASVTNSTMSIKKILYVNTMDDYMGVGSPGTNVTRFRALAAMPGLDV